MAKERLSMRKIKEVLRLRYECRLSFREIGLSCQVAISTAAEYYRRAQAAMLLTWADMAPLSESELELRLYPPALSSPSNTRPQPDFAHIREELRKHKRVNLTLDLLWQEYKQQHPDGYQYSQFCDLNRQWLKKQDLCMRQTHKAGEKAFVDYGDGLFITDPQTGQQTLTYLFVMVWGASNFTYAEATVSQDLASWTTSHKRAFEYFGCVPHVVVSDNLKSGVTKPCRYEPDLNPTYADMAEHYGIALIPTRPKKPKDKAKVEVGVLITKRWILAVLRNRVFTSLGEMNAAIRELLEKVNTKKMIKTKQTRRELFETLDKPNAKALPEKPYEYADWWKGTVNIDYHIDVERHYYSVPCTYRQQEVHARLTPTTIEIFHKGERIAAHPRSFIKFRHTTLKEHMPLEHQKHMEWNPSRLKAWAEKTGPHTAQFVERLMQSKAYPEQAYRACLGVLRLSQKLSPQRVEAAAKRALRYNMCSYKNIQLILQRNLDQQPDPMEPPASLPPHDNIRGESYYQ